MAPETHIATVLMADDSESIRKLGELCLRRIGRFTTITVSSGLEAVRRARADHPDLILLDANMPEMDGPSTLKLLRKSDETGSIPVVFLTASVKPADLDLYRSLGAAGVIPKPFSPATFGRQIREIIDQAA